MVIDILFFVVIFLTNIMQGITGFAGTILAMPPSIFLKGIEVSKPVLNMLGLLASIWVLKVSHKHVKKNEFFKIMFIMFVGVMIGNYIYSKVETAILLKIYALFIILIALKGILIKKKILLNENILLIILFLSGIIHGMFVSGGPLLVIYAAQKIKDKTEFRATISAVWIILNIFMIWNHYSSGLLTPSTMKLIVLGIIPLLAGMIIGNKLHYTMSQEAFLYLTYILLLISGCSLLF